MKTLRCSTDDADECSLRDFFNDGTFFSEDPMCALF